MKRFHCLFEQSGTFKNEFKKLGYEAYDYDILNDFGETDYQIDLYAEIEKCYEGGKSIFDDITQEDEILCFFPCTRFEDQILLSFRGENLGMKNWTEIKKLKYDLRLHQELSQNYELITKLAMIVFERNFKMIFENPWSTQHYLHRYWCIKPAVIDYDRRERGDYMSKPTQYFFLGRKPSNNFILEPQVIKPKRTHNEAHKFLKDSEAKNVTALRSMISKEYANRFIREFIL